MRRGLAGLILLGILAAAPEGARPRDPVTQVRGGERHASDSAPATTHDFHVVYGRMAVESNLSQVHLRFFQDDLALGLRQFSGDPDIRLAANPQVDSLVSAYLNRHFVVQVSDPDAEEDPGYGPPLVATIAASGEESDGSEQIWWYVMQYEAAAPIERLRVRNELLFELFDDQRNILRVQHFPSERRQTFYLTPGSSEAEFSL